MLIVPGITSSSRDFYVTHCVQKAIECECVAVVMNYRGISVDLLTPRFYTVENYEDLELVIDHVKNTFPDCSIVAVGSSFGMLFGVIWPLFSIQKFYSHRK